MVSLTNFRTFSELAPENLNTFQSNYQTTTTNQNSFNEETKQEQVRQADKLQQKQSDTRKQFSAAPNSNLFQAATISDKVQSNKKNHFEIRWTNLNYQVESKWYQRVQLTSSSAETHRNAQPTKKSILCNLNGSVKSGQVTAILGPSGAGKTSLLGCLTGKNKSGVSGSVQVITSNGGSSNSNDKNNISNINSINISSLSASSNVVNQNGNNIQKPFVNHHKQQQQQQQQYNEEEAPPMQICTIPQKDYLLNQLTVRENLWFASRLKHPEDNFDHDSNIERVVDLLKLDTCIDTKISKVSGGQYKRVSIAQELLSNPDILILDEPTSGLDSLTCYKTVMVLRDLARMSPNPMAIIVTIHQPQREVFDLFNHVYILAVGGRCIYEGPPKQSIKTINECSGGLHFDQDQYNPASYLVEIASSEFGEKPIEALVEHQRRDFKRRVLEQVMDSCTEMGSDPHQMTDGQRLQQQQQLAAIAAGLTPGIKKRSQSPMLSRFKNTISNLTGSSSSLNANNNSSSSPLTGKKLKVQQQFAYTNQAYDASNQLCESPAVNVTIPSGDENQQAPSYFEALDASNQAMKLHKKSASNNNNNNNNNVSLPAARQQQQQQLHNNLIYQFASDHFDGNSASSAGGDSDEFYLDERLQTHKHNHKGHFLRHCRLLTKRSWLCLCKDPMLTTLRFSAHIIVPLLITIVYGNRVGKPNACPLYESNMDLIDYARTGAKRLLTLQDDLRCTFENVGLYFLSIYAFTFSTMCLTSLSFPLNMHVLLKEVRNGWYSIPTYFIGKTLADFPLEFILPTLTLMITYPLTGQPSSYLEWRFFLATGIFVVTSLIAQTQGLIFGALFMNAMQAAVFVAPVSTTPLILLSGFLIRISQMPIYLQKLSTFSYFRYAIESLTIIRYGFGQCPCDPSVVTGKPVSAVGVPDQLRTMTNYWLSTFDNDNNGGEYSVSANEALNDTLTELVTTTIAPSVTNLTAIGAGGGESPPAQVDFFQDLTVLLARANSFGADIKTCKDLKPYPMIDFSLEDNQLYVWVAALVATLFVSKIVNYLVVKYSVKWRL